MYNEKDSFFRNMDNNNLNIYDNNKLESRKKNNKIGKISSYFFTALIAALIGGMIGAYIFPVYIMGNIIPYPLEMDSNKSQQMNQISINTDNDVYFATAVAEKATKSVVGITVIQTYEDYFWGKQRVEGMGSGVIVNQDGYILTNSHVIGDGSAEEITVMLDDGTQENGVVLWYDTTLDLAIVKIDRTGLPAAEIGDSDEILIGEPVVAIGNPLSLELERSVTSGIVSGLNRSLQTDTNTVIESLIQTDASINPGNSGGPLLNAKGEVIGINTAKMTSAEGLGFSIPINIAMPMVEQIINEGKVSSVYIGIRGIDVQGYEERLNLDISAEYGVVIVEVINNSPSSKIDLQTGDVIQQIDGDKIENMNDLKRKLYEYKNGDKAYLTIYRNGNIINKTVTFEEKPNNY